LPVNFAHSVGQGREFFHVVPMARRLLEFGLPELHRGAGVGFGGIRFAGLALEDRNIVLHIRKANIRLVRAGLHLFEPVDGLLGHLNRFLRIG